MSIPSAPFQSPEYLSSYLEQLGSGGSELTGQLQFALKETNRLLEEGFAKHQPVEELVRQRARLLDQIILCAWKKQSKTGNKPISLISVGGYGRGELHPHSDIDLLVLMQQAPSKEQCKEIEQFLYILWDLGLEIGHAVRTIKECVSVAEKDVTVFTNLVEARQLCDLDDLFSQLKYQLDLAQVWPPAEFFTAKLEEQKQRHHKFGDTGYNLEPNLKASPGGLRDIQTIGWVAKRRFDTDSFRGLVREGFLTDEEYNALSKGQHFLWQLRFGLHLLANRKEDRLIFDHQKNLAQMLGYEDTPERLGVEHMMKEYFRTVTELSELNDMLLQLFEEDLLCDENCRTVTEINQRFQIRNQRIEVTDENVFKKSPFALIEIFLLMAQQDEIEGVQATTIRLIRQNRHLIDQQFRVNIQNRSFFMELLRLPHGVYRQLVLMKRYGVLGAYIPEFGQIEGQMQYDLFHSYTVDEHTLILIENLRRFWLGKEFPLCCHIMQNLAKPELIYLAGLFHDIGKGRGGDHSQLGAVDARAFCQRHGLGSYDSRLVAWLVQSHLLMSTTAQRQDISDPDVIHDFALIVGDQVHLDYLYVLTVADIRATNAKLWNSWRQHLLQDLYTSTRLALRRGLSNPQNKSQLIKETQEKSWMILTGHNASPMRTHELWSSLGEVYFIHQDPRAIARHTRAIINHKQTKQPLILVSQREDFAGTEIFTYLDNRSHIFARVTSTLEKLGLNIVSARIQLSADNRRLDTYTVLDRDNQPISSEYISEKIHSRLLAALSADSAPSLPSQSFKTRKLKHFEKPTRVSFSPDSHNTMTVMELYGLDHPGLLAKVARTLLENNAIIHSAHIATYGEKIEDVFFISDMDGNPIEDSEKLSLLREQIIQQLDPQDDASDNDSDLVQQACSQGIDI
ncbi:[protein-PII] uridylyltransferase [Pelagibaculum spongiae]|uniref:Bifunctional uridylyltransferase/uridylyl-removing enzyme n=1 Tax=Pelagibaculum spongiae TaxID=2080658 RepID=A0A2V1GT90_9GAMM|nr:[protein-PII] uridylyltransferase [Pelagibaculum spongiae]PVZ64915.1 [protein-PII] uridylyltransferase [Pelagibaculum spongiae]